MCLTITAALRPFGIRTPPSILQFNFGDSNAGEFQYYDSVSDYTCLQDVSELQGSCKLKHTGEENWPIVMSERDSEASRSVGGIPCYPF